MLPPWQSGWLWNQGDLLSLPFLPPFVEFDLVGSNLRIGHEFGVAMLAEKLASVLFEGCLCRSPDPRGERSFSRLVERLLHESSYVFPIHIY